MPDREITIEEWVRRNPWEICNTASTHTRCGRYPDKDAAVEASKRYHGGPRSIDESARRVYVNEMPSL